MWSSVMSPRRLIDEPSNRPAPEQRAGDTELSLSSSFHNPFKGSITELQRQQHLPRSSVCSRTDGDERFGDGGIGKAMSSAPVETLAMRNPLGASATAPVAEWPQGRCMWTFVAEVILSRGALLWAPPMESLSAPEHTRYKSTRYQTYSYYVSMLRW